PWRKDDLVAVSRGLRLKGGSAGSVQVRPRTRLDQAAALRCFLGSEGPPPAGELCRETRVANAALPPPKSHWAPTQARASPRKLPSICEETQVMVRRLVPMTSRPTLILGAVPRIAVPVARSLARK